MIDNQTISYRLLAPKCTRLSKFGDHGLFLEETICLLAPLLPQIEISIHVIQVLNTALTFGRTIRAPTLKNKDKNQFKIK